MGRRNTNYLRNFYFLIPLLYYRHIIKKGLTTLAEEEIKKLIT